jgi:hypothetical protein
VCSSAATGAGGREKKGTSLPHVTVQFLFVHPLSAGGSDCKGRSGRDLLNKNFMFLGTEQVSVKGQSPPAVAGGSDCKGRSAEDLSWHGNIPEASTTMSGKVAVFSFEKYDNHFLEPALSALVGADNVKKLPVRLCAQSADLATGFLLLVCLHFLSCLLGLML